MVIQDTVNDTGVPDLESKSLSSRENNAGKKRITSLRSRFFTSRRTDSSSGSLDSSKKSNTSSKSFLSRFSFKRNNLRSNLSTSSLPNEKVENSSNEVIFDENNKKFIQSEYPESLKGKEENVVVDVSAEEEVAKVKEKVENLEEIVSDEVDVPKEEVNLSAPNDIKDKKEYKFTYIQFGLPCVSHVSICKLGVLEPNVLL